MMRRRQMVLLEAWIFSFLLLSTLVVFGCKSESPEKECTVDSDCPAGKACIDGNCVGGGCQNDGDCLGDQVCQDGQCVAGPECKIDGDCQVVGQVCQDGQCVAGPECKIDGDCQVVGQVCQDGQCVAGPECKVDGDCPVVGQVCQDGQCVTVQPGEEVVRAGFGSGPDELGRIIPEDGNPEGPMSFVIGSADQIYILDQLNSRVQVFQNGTRINTIPILASTFEDIDLNQQGSIILLDRLVHMTLAFFDSSGNLQKQADLIGKGIDEGGGVTGIDSRDDGVWVHIGDTSVRVTDASGDPVEDRTLVEGRFSLDGQYQLKSEKIGEVSAVVQRSLTGSADWETFPTVVFDKPVLHLTGLYTDSDNRIYLGAYLSEDGNAVEEVVVLGSSGQEERRVLMPVAADVVEMFRTLRVTSGGVIFQLAIDETGVVVRRYVP